MGSPIPMRKRLNFSVPSSSTIERRPPWPPWLPDSRNRSLPKAKSSATMRRSPSGALARENLAHGEARVVHPGQRLDQRQIEAVVPPHDDVGGRAAGHGRPTGTLREPVEHEPTDVASCRHTAHSGSPSPTTTSSSSWPRAARSSGQHDAARSRPNQPPESGLSSWEGLAAMVPGPPRAAGRGTSRPGGPAAPRQRGGLHVAANLRNWKVCSVSALAPGALGSTRTECIDRIRIGCWRSRRPTTTSMACRSTCLTRPKQSLLQGAHHALVGGRGVVLSADGASRASRAAAVHLLPTSGRRRSGRLPGRGLVVRSLDRHDDVAEVDACRGAGRPANRPLRGMEAAATGRTARRSGRHDPCASRSSRRARCRRSGSARSTPGWCLLVQHGRPRPPAWTSERGWTPARTSTSIRQGGR